MATEHVFKVTLNGYADAQVVAWIEALSKYPGVQVEDFPPMTRLPLPGAPAVTAPVRSAFPIGRKVPATTPMARPAAVAAPAGLPISKTTGQPIAKPTTVPFDGANVHPSKGNAGWVAYDRMTNLRWLWNDDARTMDDGTSGAYRWKTKVMNRWFTPEEMYATTA